MQSLHIINQSFTESRAIRLSYFRIKQQLQKATNVWSWARVGHSPLWKLTIHLSLLGYNCNIAVPFVSSDATHQVIESRRGAFKELCKVDLSVDESAGHF